MNPEVINEPFEVDSELRTLGLTRETLTEALRAGLFERANSVETNHPGNYAGIKMWAETTCALGDILVPQGWTRDDSKNLASTINPEDTVALVVASGDTATGSDERTPTTKHDKGVVTQQRVRSNQKVLEFDEEARSANLAADSTPDELRGTWILLHCIVGDELRCELSRPTLIDASGYIREWSKRLILTPLPLGPVRETTRDDEPIEPVVNIRRRGNE